MTACGELHDFQVRRLGVLAFFAIGTLPGWLISTASACLLTAWDAEHLHLPPTGFLTPTATGNPSCSSIITTIIKSNNDSKKKADNSNISFAVATFLADNWLRVIKIVAPHSIPFPTVERSLGTRTTTAPSGDATGFEASSTKTAPSQDIRPETVNDAKFLSLIPEVGSKSDTKKLEDGDEAGTKEK